LNKMKNVWITPMLGIALLWSSAGYAGCTPSQVTGVWEAAFSNGNSCRFKLKPNGTIDTADAVCYDPDRGTAGFDSGTVKVKGDCFAEGEVVIGGVTVELPVQFSSSRGTAAGRFRIPDDGSKGSVVMVRVP